MGFNFPNTPTVGDKFAPSGGPTYKWDGLVWKADSINDYPVDIIANSAHFGDPTSVSSVLAVTGNDWNLFYIDSYWDNTNTGSRPDLEIWSSRASWAAGDYAGAIRWYDGEGVELAGILVNLYNVGAGLQDSNMWLRTVVDGVAQTQMVLYQNTVQLNYGRLQFPASANPSTNANIMDDYEEGSWTPNLLFGGAQVGMTFGTRLGRYRKSGNKVAAWFDVPLTAKGTSVGSASIAGLPFSGLSNMLYAGSMGYTTGMTAGFAQIWCYVGPTASITLTSPNVATASNPTAINTAADTNFTNASRIIGFVEYEAT